MSDNHANPDEAELNPFEVIGLNDRLVRLLIQNGYGGFRGFLKIYRRALTPCIHPDVSATRTGTAARILAAFDTLQAVDADTLAGFAAALHLSSFTEDHHRAQLSASRERVEHLEKANRNLRDQNERLQRRLCRLEQVCEPGTATLAEWEAVEQKVLRCRASKAR